MMSHNCLSSGPILGVANKCGLEIDVAFGATCGLGVGAVAI